MIQINSNTTQKTLIELLLSSLAGQGNLYIQVLSLPYFLSSITSIKVFQYKIQNYPRNILWYSNDNRIFEFLSHSSLNAGFPQALEGPKSRSTTNISFAKNTSDQIQYTPKPKITKDEIIALNLTDYSEPTQFNFSHPNLLDEFRKKHLGQEQKQDFKQDLDNWLKKIESTKEALSRHQYEVDQKSSFYNPSSILDFFKSKLFVRSFLSIGIIAIVLGLFLSYPTNIYKLEVAPVIGQKAIDTTIPSSLFGKTTIKLNTNTELPATGTDLITNSRSQGKVLLVNNSPAKVDFAREGIILISESNGLEYRHKATSTDPINLSVPSKNTQIGQRIEIDIQATQPGKQYNLPINGVFRVFNLNGQAMGSAFRAIASTEINTTSQSKQTPNTVTEDDVSLLRSKVESEFLDQKTAQFSSLRDQNQITNPTWVKVSATNYDYKTPVGTQTTTASISANAEGEILSIPKDKLQEFVKTQLENKEITDITIIESKLEGEKVTAKLFVSYKQSENIAQIDTPSYFKKQEFVSAKAQLQQEHPNIKRVSQEFNGFNFPLIKPFDKVQIQNIQS
jgi:hypothetical protein